MFNLDKVIFQAIYDVCSSLGSGFGFGAFEGLMMYLLIISGTVTAYFGRKYKK